MGYCDGLKLVARWEFLRITVLARDCLQDAHIRGTRVASSIEKYQDLPGALRPEDRLQPVLAEAGVSEDQQLHQKCDTSSQARACADQSSGSRGQILDVAPPCNREVESGGSGSFDSSGSDANRSM